MQDDEYGEWKINLPREMRNIAELGIGNFTDGNTGDLIRNLPDKMVYGEEVYNKKEPKPKQDHLLHYFDDETRKQIINSKQVNKKKPEVIDKSYNSGEWFFKPDDVEKHSLDASLYINTRDNIHINDTISAEINSGTSISEIMKEVELDKERDRNMTKSENIRYNDEIIKEVEAEKERERKMIREIAIQIKEEEKTAIENLKELKDEFRKEGLNEAEEEIQKEIEIVENTKIMKMNIQQSRLNNSNTQQSRLNSHKPQEKPFSIFSFFCSNTNTNSENFDRSMPINKNTLPISNTTFTILGRPNAEEAKFKHDNIQRKLDAVSKIHQDKITNRSEPKKIITLSKIDKEREDLRTELIKKLANERRANEIGDNKSSESNETIIHKPK